MAQRQMAENRGKLGHQMAHKTLVLHSQRVLPQDDLRGPGMGVHIAPLGGW